MSKVIDIAVKPTTLPPEIKRKIKAANVQEGDTIKFSLEKELTIMLVLMVVAIVYVVLSAQKKASRRKEGEDVLNSLIDGSKTKEQLEQEIADEYGVNIEFELAKSKLSPLDAAFGIWENNDITIEQIREKAWPKRA